MIDRRGSFLAVPFVGVFERRPIASARNFKVDST
jgi:hypothetical protein